MAGHFFHQKQKHAFFEKILPFTCGAYLKFTYLCKYDEPYRTPKEKPSFVPDARTVVCDGTSGAKYGFPHT